MRKNWIIGLILLLIGGWWGWGQLSTNPAIEEVAESGLEMIENENQASLIIDFGEMQATYSAAVQEGETALSLLQRLSDQKHKLTIKHYDFGDLVEGIDGYENGPERAWIYFVNGNSGDVGAGDKAIVPGDELKWSYMKPSY